jgi:HEAT repeat protein
MKLRSFLMALIAAVPMIASAQVAPPTPPTPPLPTEPPTAPLPATAPRLFPIEGQRLIDIDEIRRTAEEAVRGVDVARIVEQAKDASRNAIRDIDFARIAEDARWASQDAIRNLDMNHIQLDGLRDAQHALAELPSFSNGFQAFGPGLTSYHWVQGDPADSTYQLAREIMGRYDYSRAAAKFAEVITKYPNSRRFSEAVYYQAFSLYRVGTLESLRLALKVLESNTSKLAYDQRGSSSDAPTLQARILRALIDRNEPGAEAKLKDLLAKYPAATCDSDANSIKSSLINSLYQSNPDEAMPYIRGYLATRDSCNAELRKTSVFLLANRPTDEKTALIISVARNDTVREVRSQAIEVLSRVPSDAAVTALQGLLKDPDERIQRAAVRSLMRSDNVKARAALRSALLDNKDAPESQRIEAIQSYDRDNTTNEDAAYLRALYNRKDESDKIKSAVISALSRVPSEENVAFLLNIAKNPNETSSLRSQALRSISRTTLSVDDLVKLYDATDSRPMRQSIVESLSSRKEDAALNKLLEIVKYSTDPEVRSYTIRNLLNKNDAAVTKKVLDLIGKP